MKDKTGILRTWFLSWINESRHLNKRYVYECVYVNMYTYCVYSYEKYFQCYLLQLQNKYKEKISEQKKPLLFDKKVIQTLYKEQNITGCGILHLHEAIFKILGL